MDPAGDPVPEPNPPAPAEAAPSRRFLIPAFLVVALLVVLDQWSKAAIFEWVRPGLEALRTDVHGHRHVPVLGEWLSVMISCNPGAAFGGFGGSPMALIGLRVVAVAFLAWILVRSDPRHRVVLGATVLVLSGALGNVIDNLWTGCTPLGTEPGLPHGVRDFIGVWFEPLIGWDYHFPNFNVADACISVGATAWLLSGLFHPASEEVTEAESGTEGAAPEHEGATEPVAEDAPVAEGAPDPSGASDRDAPR